MFHPITKVGRGIRPSYHNNKMSAITITDENSDVHILFSDEQFMMNNFHETTHLFIDATFGCRPNLENCSQFCNVLGILANRVSINYLFCHNFWSLNCRPHIQNASVFLIALCKDVICAI